MAELKEIQIKQLSNEDIKKLISKLSKENTDLKNKSASKDEEILNLKNINASKDAEILSQNAQILDLKIVEKDEHTTCRGMLKAAALTYVASVLAAILEIIRLLWMTRRDD